MLTNREFHLQTGNLAYKTGFSFTKRESWVTKGILGLLFTDKMIQYLGEHKLFNEKYIIFILFCIFLIEFKNYFSHKNKEKWYTLVILLMYLGEAILFLMPYENYIVDIMCTLFGIVLILCLILRYKSRKG